VSARVLLPVAAVGLSVAGAMAYGFVRQVPVRAGAGVITAAVFVPADTWRRRAITPRGPTVAERRVALPARYRFTLAVDGEPQPLYYALDSARAAAFTVGQRVRVHYERRGLGPLWHRAYVSDMAPAGPP
jgi:hypothetical protein